MGQSQTYKSVCGHVEYVEWDSPKLTSLCAAMWNMWSGTVPNLQVCVQPCGTRGVGQFQTYKSVGSQVKHVVSSKTVTKVLIVV